MSNALVIRGGTIVDSNGTRAGDVACVDGTIVELADAPTSARTVDATGCFVTTGLVDLHAHLGEPGDEAAETMHAAGRAAVAGGYTTVLAMPNTYPCVDTAAVVEHVRLLGNSALCKVEIAGAVTVGRAGERLAPLGELAAAGVRIVTDCDAGIQDPLMLRRALEYSRPLGLVIAQPADCAALRGEAQMHEGAWSSRLGLSGAPAEAEEINVMRDISIARLTGGRLHFQTLSTAGSYAIVAAASRSGVDVSAEVASHHLTLADRDLSEYDTNRKVWPPLRDVSDAAAAVDGIANASIDVIVSDHTPHTTDRKERPFDQAAVGTVALETTLAATLSAGVAPEQAFRAMSWRPAELLGLGSPDERSVVVGHRADLVVVDPDEAWTVNARKMETMGTNSAFEGQTLTGRVRATIVDGDLVFHTAELVAA